MFVLTDEDNDGIARIIAASESREALQALAVSMAGKPLEWRATLRDPDVLVATYLPHFAWYVLSPLTVLR